MKAALLSGGMDSAALVFWRRPEISCVVDYGQRCAAAEIRAARSVCRAVGSKLVIVRANCRSVGSGDLAGEAKHSLAPSREWWPFRNQLLATLAAAKLVGLGVEELYFGTVKTDGFHADGRLEFFVALDALLSSQEGRIRVSAPAIELTATELVLKSGVGIDILGWTHSCHVANMACGVCRGCTKKIETLSELGWWT